MRGRGWLLLGVVAIRLPTLTEPAWYSDDGFFSAVGWSMSKGLALYAQVFDNSPPGIYWLFRGLIALGAGEHNWIIQLTAAVAVAASALLVLEVASRVIPGWPAGLAAAITAGLLSVPTLDGDSINVELAGLPFFLAALAIAFRPGWASAIVSGLLLAAATTFRPTYAIDAVAVLVPLLGVNRRPWERLGLAIAGGAAGLLLVATAMAVTGSLGAYVTVVMPSNHGYLVWSNGGSYVPLVLRLVFLAAAGAAAYSRARSAAGRLAAVWLPAALGAASVTPREFSHYAQEAIPAIAFAAALLAARFRPRIVAGGAAAAAALIAVPLLLVLPAWLTAPADGAATGWHPDIPYSRLPAYYGNWWRYVTGSISAREYADWFPGYQAEEAAATALRARAAPNSRLAVLGDEPWLFIHVHELPATNYLATNSAFWQVPSAPPEVRLALEDGKVPVVVVAPNGRGWEDDVRAGPYVELTSQPWPIFGRMADA